MHEGDFIILSRALELNWAQLARELGISERQLRRYRRGEAEVPPTLQLAIEGLICRKLHQGKSLGSPDEDEPTTARSVLGRAVGY